MPTLCRNNSFSSSCYIFSRRNCDLIISLWSLQIISASFLSFSHFLYMLIYASFLSLTGCWVLITKWLSPVSCIFVIVFCVIFWLGVGAIKSLCYVMLCCMITIGYLYQWSACGLSILCASLQIFPSLIKKMIPITCP